MQATGLAKLSRLTTKGRCTMATKAKFAVGQQVVFNGYADDVPDAERVLVEGETYELAEVSAKDETVSIQVDNPDFNPKKKESDTNSRLILVDVFFDEVSEPAEEVADEEVEAEAEVEEEPAPRARTKAPAAAKAAPVAAKGKVAPAAKGKAAPVAKGKAIAKPKVKEEAPEEEADHFPELDSEDADIVTLVSESADLLELATELLEDQGAIDYKLGGVLYHLRLGKTYQEADAAYAEKGGWGKYIEDKLPGLGYRKAMHLIEIYYNFNLHGIDAAKVQELGWTKCSKIAAVMNDENAGELVELAEGSSVSELNDAIKESYKEVGGVKGEKRKKIQFKFRLWEDQASAVEETINGVAAQMGFKDVSDAFEHIVMEWAAEHPLSTKKTVARPAATAKAAPAVAKSVAKTATRAK